MKRLIEFFVEQHLFGILLGAFTILIGLGALFLIQRERFPNVSYDVITVVTVFPGATAEEVEQLITNPLEKDVKEVDGIKRLTSHSISGRSSILVELDPDLTTEEEAKSDLRDVVDKYKPELPDGAEDPVISALESKLEPLIEVHVMAELPPMELREIAKGVKEELEDITGVARVDAPSLRDLEIRVETNLRTLQRYHLATGDLVTALRSQNLSISGGSIETTDQGEFLVRTTGKFQTLEDVKRTVIRANDLGQAIQISDVAKVTYDLEKTSTLNHTNGKPSIELNLLKKERYDAIDLVKEVRKK